MQPDGPVLEELSRADCLRLLATATIGRISYTRQALPAVEPVNFALHDGAIVIRTDAGDLAGLDKLGLESWAPGTRNNFIRIEPGIVTGRRLRGT
jgi:hypothetical protein